jgi:uncharacterized protein involved in exopolysaccharide biosynthesis
MQNLLNSEASDEINLREFFITLWAYKLLISSTCALGIVIGGYNALHADKVFTSTAIFKLDKQNSKGSLLSGQLGALANITGLATVSDNTAFPEDMLNGRVFIEKLDARLNLQADPYFNTYNPNPVDPIWKSLIKSAIGWQKSSKDPQEVTWQGIIKKYYSNISMETTPEESIKIKATHANPQRAAEIANTIMDEIISSAKNKKHTEQDQQLSYMANTLANALSDLEVSQSNLKKFALENSALPLESFAARSFQLDTLRDQLNRTSELHEAVAALSLILQDNTTDHNAYLALRQKFPIVDQVEFRRVLGQNEITSSWSWPEASTIDAVFNTLTERKVRLQSTIDASLIDAERSSLALETYAKLEREAKISEASYTVLIEQVKAQNMAAGYRPDKTEIYEYAFPSISPSAPKTSLILILGAVIGLLIGVAFSYVLALYRGVYYTKNHLITGAQARLSASVKTLLPLRNKSLNDINTILVKKPHSALRDMAVEIHKSATSQVVVTSLRAKLTGNDVALALASYMQSDAMRVAVIDFSSRVKKLDFDNEKISIGSFVVAESAGQISILRPDGDLVAMELLRHRDFWENMQSLKAKFDLVFLCADNTNAVSLLSALEGQKIFHITITRTKKTKSAILMHIRSLLPIQGLFHD